MKSSSSNPRKGVRPAAMDPLNSVSVFDISRRNQFGGVYCVAAAVLPSEVDREWKNYLNHLESGETGHEG